MMQIAAGVMAAMLAVAGFADTGDNRTGRVAMPTIKIETGGACVAPTAEMRRDHMKMLLHQRDGTVHEGLREPRFSLKHCIDCHASRETGSVLGKDGFCSSCHTYASVSIDCFECHTPLRQSRVAGTASR
jgi:hypothetical protein